MTVTKYNLCAFIDLLGFSAHLEMADADVRTEIGEIATRRLSFLEQALSHVAEDQAATPQFYPANFRAIRINDAIGLSLDLSSHLIPERGTTFKTSWSPDGLEALMPEMRAINTEEEFSARYRNVLSEQVQDVVKFVALAARLFTFVNNSERSANLPGCRAVLATGFRRPFITSAGIDDHFSANLAFANCYIADSKLGKGGFFVDTNILRLLYAEVATRIVTQHARYVSSEFAFDPLDHHEEPLGITSRYSTAPAREVALFRKTFYFLAMNPRPLCILPICRQLSEQALDRMRTGSVTHWCARATTTAPPANGETYKGTILNIINLDISQRLNKIVQADPSGG